MVIVLVHVVAVVLAHRHLADGGHDERKARRSEYPWLVAMVADTAFSLYLIAQPLVQQGPRRQTGRHTRATDAHPVRLRSAAGALAIVTVGFLTSHQPVPIYGGFPHQPYRLIGDATRGEPSVATGTAHVGADGRSGALSARSNESGPQVVLELGAGAFQGAHGATIGLTATPIPMIDPPRAGTADSNVHRVLVVTPVNSSGVMLLGFRGLPSGRGSC